MFKAKFKTLFHIDKMSECRCKDALHCWSVYHFKKNAVILFISKTRYNVSFYTINLGFPKLVVYEYNMA